MSRPTILHVGSTLFWELLTFDPDAPGVLKDADSTPTVAVRKNGVSTVDSVTVTKRTATTGIYDCSYDPASEMETDSFQLSETIVITGTTTVQKTYHNSFHVTVLATASDVSSFIANSIENNTNNWDAAIPVINAAVLAALPATGRAASQASVDALEDTLDSIYSQTSQITGSRINTVGPVSAAGDITLIIGKDYKVASESELTISVPDTAGALHADFTSGTLAASKAFGMSRANGDADIAGTVSSVTYAANVTTFKIEIDADQLPDTLELAYDYTYQIERVTSGGDKVVGVQGAGEVKMRAV